MNRKLKRYLDEEEKTQRKIDELQDHLKNVRAARKIEEDAAIVRSIRGMKLQPQELLDLLNGIQSGDATISLADLIEADDGEEDAEDIDDLIDQPGEEADYGEA